MNKRSCIEFDYEDVKVLKNFRENEVFYIPSSDYKLNRHIRRILTIGEELELITIDDAMFYDAQESGFHISYNNKFDDIIATIIMHDLTNDSTKENFDMLTNTTKPNIIITEPRIYIAVCEQCNSITGAIVYDDKFCFSLMSLMEGWLKRGYAIKPCYTDPVTVSIHTCTCKKEINTGE